MVPDNVAAWMELIVYDPANIPLTTSQNWLNWQVDNNCARHGRGIHKWDMHTSTGWLFTNHTHSWPNYTCSKLADYADNLYANPIFCLANTTYTDLQNEIDGLWEHNADFRPNIIWWGGCTNFLHGYVDYDVW
jgi:hypothetical protein